MKTINWEFYYEIEDVSKMLDKKILEQADILRKNLQEKRKSNTSIKNVEYV